MKASIVVVSNDSKIRETLRQFFKHYDYKIQFRDLSSSTLLALYENAIQIIILDIEENDRSVLNVIDIVRQTHPALSIVALCGDTSVEKVRELKQRGVFYCAMKPVQPAEMEKVIEAHKRLQRKRESQGQIFPWAIRPARITA